VWGAQWRHYIAWKEDQIKYSHFRLHALLYQRVTQRLEKTDLTHAGEFDGRPILRTRLFEVCSEIENQLDDVSSSARFGGADSWMHLNTRAATVTVESTRSITHCLQSVKLSEERRWSLWCDQTSTTSSLVEQLHLSPTDTAEDVEEYRPVSRYRSPDDWGQLTSPMTEPRVWSMDNERRMGPALCMIFNNIIEYNIYNNIIIMLLLIIWYLDKTPWLTHTLTLSLSKCTR